MIPRSGPCCAGKAIGFSAHTCGASFEEYQIDNEMKRMHAGLRERTPLSRLQLIRSFARDHFFFDGFSPAGAFSAAFILNATHAVHHCLSMELLAYPW